MFQLQGHPPPDTNVTEVTSEAVPQAVGVPQHPVTERLGVLAPKEPTDVVVLSCTQKSWKDRDVCVRELLRAAEESTLLRQSLEHITKACDSYQQQLQEILDQRNLLYRDYATSLLQMKAKCATMEQSNTHLKQVNAELQERLSYREAAAKEEPQAQKAVSAAEVVLLRHKLQRACPT